MEYGTSLKAPRVVFNTAGVIQRAVRASLAENILACVAADSFPFSGGAEIEQANEKRASEGARLGGAILPLFRSFPPVRERAFGKGKETAATQAKNVLLWQA